MSRTSFATASPAETHLLFVLLDSNLPTGGFVSSSGLESYAKHGFLHPSPSFDSNATSRDETLTQPGPSRGPGLSPSGMAQAITRFAEAEVENYARSTGPFVGDAWELVRSAMTKSQGLCRNCGGRREKGKARAPDAHDAAPGLNDILPFVLDDIVRLDKHHEACLLSHVSRRSSKAQGVAMLTLFSRGLSRPAGLDAFDPPDGLLEPDRGLPNEPPDARREELAKALVEGYKRLIRKGTSPGHLAVCWGVMTAALGLPLDRALHLHLFLHARSLLSSAVRLNLIGPYLSCQLLLHPFQSMLDKHLGIASHTRIGLFAPRSCSCSEDAFLGADTKAQSTSQAMVDPVAPAEADDAGPTRQAATGGHRVKNDEQLGADAEPDFWSWTEEAESGPATTWPLGELLMARHDLQHSRIFNS